MSTTKPRGEARSVLKVLILGDGAVGKSCIMTRFINSRFEENSFHTIGVEFLNKEFTCHGKNYTLQVSTKVSLLQWDCLYDSHSVWNSVKFNPYV